MKNKIVRKKTFLAVAMLMFCGGFTSSLPAGDPMSRTVPLEITPNISNNINVQFGGTNGSSYAELDENDNLPTVSGSFNGYIAKGITINDSSSGIVINDGEGSVNITFAGSGVHENIGEDPYGGYDHPYGGDQYGGDDIIINDGGIVVDANGKEVIYGILTKTPENVSDATVHINGSKSKSSEYADIFVRNGSVDSNDNLSVFGIHAAGAEGTWSIADISMYAYMNGQIGTLVGVNAMYTTGSWNFTDSDINAVVKNGGVDASRVTSPTGIDAMNATGSWNFTNSSIKSCNLNVVGGSFGICAASVTGAWTFTNSLIVSQSSSGSANGVNANGATGAWTFTNSLIGAQSSSVEGSIGVKAVASSGNWSFDNFAVMSVDLGENKNYAIDAKNSTGNWTFSGENSVLGVNFAQEEQNDNICNYYKANNIGINIGGDIGKQLHIIFTQDSKTNILGGIGNLYSDYTPNTVISINKGAEINVYGDCSGVKTWYINGTMRMPKTIDTTLSMFYGGERGEFHLKNAPQGTLTVGNQETVVFGTHSDGSCGTIQLDGDGTSPQLFIKPGARFALDMLDNSTSLPGTSLVNFHVVKTPNVNTAVDIAKLISINDNTINAEATVVDGYYRISVANDTTNYSQELISLSDEYANISAMRLFISTRPNKCGLVMLTLIKLDADSKVTIPAVNTIDLSGYYSDETTTATIKKTTGGTLKITGNCDNFYGTLAIETGEIEFTEAANYKGTITIAKDTQLTLAKPSSVAKLTVTEGSVKLGAAGEYRFGTVSFGSTWDTMNGAADVTTLDITNLTMTGENSWKLKLNPEAGTSDTLKIETLTNYGYKVLITDYSLIGAVPTAESYELKVLTVDNGDYPEIEIATAKELHGYKLFASDNDGYISLKRLISSGWASGLTDDEKSSIESGFIPTKNMNEMAYNNISTTIIDVMGTTRYYEFDVNGEIKGELGYRIWNTLSGTAEKFKMNDGSAKIKNTGAEEIFGIDFAPKMFGNKWYAIPTVFIGFDHNRVKYDGQKCSQKNWLVGSKLALINNKYSFELLGMYKSIETKAKGGNSCKISSDVLSIGANVGVSFKATTNVTIKPEVLVDYSHIWISDNHISNVTINNENNDIWDVSPALNFMFGTGKFKANIAPRYHQKLSSNSKSKIGGYELPNKSEKNKYFEISAELKYDDQKSFEAGLRFSEYFAGRTGCKVTLDLSKKF